MKSFILIIYLINTIICVSNINGVLETTKPFSIKKGYNEVAIFMENYITIYESKSIPPNTITDHPTPPDTNSCDSNEEKGGIYFKGFYYTSCLVTTSSNNFVINIYNHDASYVKTISDSTFKFYSGSSIRFFKISSGQTSYHQPAFCNACCFCASVF